MVEALQICFRELEPGIPHTSRSSSNKYLPNWFSSQNCSPGKVLSNAVVLEHTLVGENLIGWMICVSKLPVSHSGTGPVPVEAPGSSGRNPSKVILPL